MSDSDHSPLPSWLGDAEYESRPDEDSAKRAYVPTPGNTDLVAPRAVAQVLDWAVIVPPVLAMEFLLAPTGIPLLLRVPIEMLVYLAYCAGFEGLNGGRTVGKMAMDLVVVSADGGPITLRQAVVRNLPALAAAYWLPYLAAISSVVTTPLHQRLFDRVADTAVVRT